jgi:hypothetical protein
MSVLYKVRFKIALLNGEVLFQFHNVTSSGLMTARSANVCPAAGVGKAYIYTYWFVTFSISSVAINFISRFCCTFPEKVKLVFVCRESLVGVHCSFIATIVGRWFVKPPYV